MRRTLLIISFIFVISSALPLLAQSESRVWQDILYSDALQTKKTFRIYLPAGYDESSQRYPVVYFLHPKGDNWFNPYVHGRDKTLKDIADSLIASGQIGKMILVDPDHGDCSTAIPGMPNMLRPDLTSGDGIGTGQFDDYLIDDLIPYVDSRYRTMADRSRRGIDGYELGGYAAVLSAVKHPELFSSVGSYEAPFMWRNLDDPTSTGIQDDKLWLSASGDSIFGAAFDEPRNVNYMQQNNAIDLLEAIDDVTLETIQSIRFHIQAANTNNMDPVELVHSGGFLGRNVQFIDVLNSRNIFNTFDELVLSAATKDDWHSAFIHASQSLKKHWDSFQETITSLPEKSLHPDNVLLAQNYPNPFNPSTRIDFNITRQVRVRMNVYNILGREVAVLVDKEMAPGAYNVVFDAKDLATGTYFYRLQAGDFVQIRKLTLLR